MKHPLLKDHTYQTEKSQLLRIANEEHLSKKSYQLMSTPQTVLLGVPQGRVIHVRSHRLGR